MLSTSGEFVEVLNFRHFARYMSFTPTGKQGKKKQIMNGIELMEEYSEIEKRENVDLRSFEKERITIIEEYPPLDWKYEKTVIYKK